MVERDTSGKTRASNGPAALGFIDLQVDDALALAQFRTSPKDTSRKLEAFREAKVLLGAKATKPLTRKLSNNCSYFPGATP